MYEIQLGGQTIGHVKVEQEGLYYRFQCHCRLSGEVVYRICAGSPHGRVNLGIPVPEGDVYVLRTSVPIKRLGEGQLYFYAIPHHDTLGERFVPLSPEEPFRYLRRLQDAFLQIREGRIGIVIPESE